MQRASNNASGRVRRQTGTRNASDSRKPSSKGGGHKKRVSASKPVQAAAVQSVAPREDMLMHQLLRISGDHRAELLRQLNSQAQS